MRRRDTTVTIFYTWEEDNREAIYDFAITATVSPGDPGDYDTPPSGPEVEFVVADLRQVVTETEIHKGSDDPRQLEIEKDFLSWLEEIPQTMIRERLEFEACEAAHEWDMAAKEEAEERRAEMRRERLLENLP